MFGSICSARCPASDHFEVTAEVTKKQRNMAHITRISDNDEEEIPDFEDFAHDDQEEFMEEE